MKKCLLGFYVLYCIVYIKTMVYKLLKIFLTYYEKIYFCFHDIYEDESFKTSKIQNKQLKNDILELKIKFKVIMEKLRWKKFLKTN